MVTTCKKASGAKNSTRPKKTAVSRQAKVSKRQAIVGRTNKKPKKPSTILQDVQAKPPRLYIPTELKLDVLQFLDRNEIEKCQLLQRSWSTTVANNSSRLPLHVLKSLRHVPKGTKNFHEYHIPRLIKETRQHYLEGQPMARWTDMKILANSPLSALWVKNTIIDEVIGFCDNKFEDKMKTLTGHVGQKIRAKSLRVVVDTSQVFWDLEHYSNQFEALSNVWNEHVWSEKLTLEMSSYEKFARYLDFAHQAPALPLSLKLHRLPTKIEIFCHDFNNFYLTEFLNGGEVRLRLKTLLDAEKIDIRTMKLTFLVSEHVHSVIRISRMIFKYMNENDMTFYPHDIELRVTPKYLLRLWYMCKTELFTKQMTCQACGQLHPKPILKNANADRAIYGCTEDVVFEHERTDEWKLQMVLSTVKNTFSLMVVRKDQNGP